jgi:hypothetical protein
MWLYAIWKEFTNDLEDCNASGFRLEELAKHGNK